MNRDCSACRKEGSEGLLSMQKNTLWEGAKRTKPNFSQWYPVPAQEEKSTNWNTRNSISVEEKLFFIAKVVKYSRGSTEKLWHLCPWRNLNPANFHSWLFSEQVCWSRWFPEAPRSISSFAISSGWAVVFYLDMFSLSLWLMITGHFRTLFFKEFLNFRSFV